MVRGNVRSRSAVRICFYISRDLQPVRVCRVLMIHFQKQIIKTDKAPMSPPGYSQGVLAAGLAFVSGQGAIDPVSGEVVGTTIREQTAQCRSL